MKKNITSNFTMISNDIITDNRISFGSRMVYMYCFSKPDDWEFYNKDVMSALDIKKAHTMAKYWSELLHSGWITREKKKNGSFEYTLHDVAIADNEHMPKMGNWGTADNGQLLEKGIHTNTELCSNITNTNINNTNSERVPVDNLSFKFSEFWLEYPIKVKRGLALKEFTKLSQTDINNILVTVKSPAFKQHCLEKGRFMQEPHNWLEGQGWLDELGVDYDAIKVEKEKADDDNKKSLIQDVTKRHFSNANIDIKNYKYADLKGFALGGMFVDVGLTQGEMYNIIRQIDKELKEKNIS